MAEPMMLDGATWQVRERIGPGIATVMARRNGELAQIARETLGVDLPDGPRRVEGGGDIAWLGAGPAMWLAIQEGSGPTLAAKLTERIGAAASVVDQCDGYLLLRFTGPGARDLLSRGAYIDLHISAFAAGSAAVTDIAHIGVILSQVDDAPTYEVAIFRSYAASFRHWIELTGAAVDADAAAFA